MGDRHAGPASYSFTQIMLHWAIAALVLWQLFVSDDPPENRLGPVAQGFFSEVLSSSHLWIGFAILILVSVRVAVRLIRGAPAPAEAGRLQIRAAQAAHFLFYVLLFFMPITGILAYYFGLPFDGVHEAGEPIFIALIVVHVAAVGWHQFVKHDSTLRRMLSPA